MALLRDRLMVGHSSLKAGILVRVQVPQPCSGKLVRPPRLGEAGPHRVEEQPRVETGILVPQLWLGIIVW